MNDSLFQIKNLKQYFSNKKSTVKAVDDVSFEIKKGETFSIVGESGCGKTTCARAVLGIYKPTDGVILWNNKDISKLSKSEKAEFRSKNQMIFQDPYSSLDPRMTVSTIIEEGLKSNFSLSKNDRVKIIAEILDTVGLGSDYASRFPHELSGGQRQRVGIARALVMNPEFLVLDEPIAALDVSIGTQIINLLMELQKEKGLTYLMISHDLGMVQNISDKVAVMYLGNIVELANSDDLFSNPQHPYTKALLSAVPSLDPTDNWLKNRIKLQGEIPTSSNISGCKFASRCPIGNEKCKTNSPEMKQISSSHFVSCFNCN
jgi:oligopeptide transport system ATP-binding protein